MREIVERQGDTIRELREEKVLLKETIKQMHKDYGCELMDPKGTISRLKEENELLTELVSMQAGTIELWKEENAKNEDDAEKL